MAPQVRLGQRVRCQERLPHPAREHSWGRRHPAVGGRSQGARQAPRQRLGQVREELQEGQQEVGTPSKADLTGRLPRHDHLFDGLSLRPDEPVRTFGDPELFNIISARKN